MKTAPERGSVTVFFSIAALALLLAAGLVATGGEKVLALNRASQLADAAARAGVQAVDVDHFLTTGELRVDQGQATENATSFLNAAGHSGIVEVSEATVNVTVTITVTRLMLPGEPITISAVGTATAVSEETGP